MERTAAHPKGLPPFYFVLFAGLPSLAPEVSRCDRCRIGLNKKYLLVFIHDHEVVVDRKYISERDREAQDSFVHSLELNPNSSYTQVYYGWFLVATAHFDEAEWHLRRAVELDPLSQSNIADQGLPFYYSRRYEEARRFYRQSLEADDKFWYGHVRLAEACEAVGDAECALAEVKCAVELVPFDAMIRCELVRMLVLAGKKDEARQLMREITTNEASPALLYFVALAYAALGETDEVLATLERSLNEKDGWFCWIRVDPRLDSLRSDPRFDALLSRTNLK